MIALQLFASEPSTSMRSTVQSVTLTSLIGPLLPGAGVTTRQREQSSFLLSSFSLSFLFLLHTEQTKKLL